jgi:hypothetical protein
MSGKVYMGCVQKNKDEGCFWMTTAIVELSAIIQHWWNTIQIFLLKEGGIVE